MRFSLPSIKCWTPPPSFRLLPSANEIVEHSSGNETVLVSSLKLVGAAEHLINSSEKRICWLSFEFSARMLLKGAVKRRFTLVFGQPVLELKKPDAFAGYFH